MLSCRYVGSGFADLASRKKSKRSFFDLWSRNESKNFTFEIFQALGFGDAANAASSNRDYPDFELAVLNRLPDPDFVDQGNLPFSLIQARALVLKNDDFKSGIDKELVAWQSFLRSEEDCRLTNKRLVTMRKHSDHAAIIHYAQRFISRVLGEAPSIDELDMSFGPGAATSCTKKTSARWKLSSPLTASNSLFRLREEITATMPAWLLPSKGWIPSTGALEFVPKSFKTYRSIIVEPLLNTIFQKGLGTCLKQRMLQSGINLYDQSVNRDRARRGSRGEDFCTIDLERASDTLSYLLVMELIPWDWFQLLDAGRSGMVTYKGSLIILNKFSSMGNGFTFELESLVFRALAHGLSRHFGSDDDTTVFGDDIVASRATSELIKNFFPDYGFTINQEKTFLDGPFREACGGDYAFGVDVRPFFLRGLRTGGRWTYATCFSFHNFLQRKPWFDKDGSVRKLLLSKIPPRLLTWGPDGYGDSYLVSHASPRTYLAPYGRKKGYEGYMAYGWVARPFRDEVPVSGDNILPAYLAGRGPSLDIYALRSPKGARMRVRKVGIYVTG